MPGTEVDVTDPKNDESTHTSAFTGFVIGVDKDNVLVRDQEGSVWSVGFSEIEKFILPV